MMVEIKNAFRRRGAGNSNIQPRGAKIAAAIALALGSVASLAANALPVLPERVGFGIDTPAGRGGQVHRVTNLNASGAGSLRACIDATGPRVCVFEVSGAIRITSDLAVRNPYITIAGQTAPSPGIMIRGAALKINTSHVLVQHIRVRAGDATDGPDINNRDSLKIETPPETPIGNIVIDHCSFSWGMDETVSLWNAWNNVTISNTIISEGLAEHPDGDTQGYGLVAGGVGAGRLALIGNLFAHNGFRNPLVRGRDLVYVNNVVYNYKNPSVDLQSENGVTTKSTVASNVFIRGADRVSWSDTVAIRTGGMGLPVGSKVFVDNNEDDGVIPTDKWSILNSDFNTSIKASAPPVWATGLVKLPSNNNAVLNEVLRYSGARPIDRDSVDTRIVQSVRDKTGRLVNCVAADGSTRCSRNAGGWPTLAENRRALTLPADYNQVDERGYTKLERWLHQMAAEVEGRSTYPPAPPRLMTGQ